MKKENDRKSRLIHVTRGGGGKEDILVEVGK